jgi:cytochrome c-type biogenesis protein
MSQDIPFIIAFLAGVFSFLSPCVLPIVPGFMSYVAGKSFSDLQHSKSTDKLSLLSLIALFILGFSLVFILMGASIDLLTQQLFNYKKELNVFSGILIILMGLFFIGLVKIPFLNFEKKINIQSLQNSIFFPFLIGIAFAFGWSPCIGPILGAVLSIAINDSIDGIILLSFYSLGLALPFILVGLLIGKLIRIIRFMNRFIKIFQIIAGSILTITGVLILNGSIQAMGFKLNSILPPLEMLLI